MFSTEMTRAAQIGLNITDQLQRKAKAGVAEEGAVAEDAGKIYTGRCLCGEVSFTAKDLSDIWYCHCKQCQHLTGLYIAAAGALREGYADAAFVECAGR